MTACHWTEPSLTSDQTGERDTARRLIPREPLNPSHSFIVLLHKALSLSICPASCHLSDLWLMRSRAAPQSSLSVLLKGRLSNGACYQLEINPWPFGSLSSCSSASSLLLFLFSFFRLFRDVSAMSGSLNSFNILQSVSRGTCQVWIIYSVYWMARSRMNNWIKSLRFNGLRKTRGKRLRRQERKKNYMNISDGHSSHFVDKYSSVEKHMRSCCSVSLSAREMIFALRALGPGGCSVKWQPSRQLVE